MILRVSRELGRPCRLHRDCRLEPRLTNSRLIHSSVPSWWGTNRGRTMVSPSEGNEARRDGRQGVAAPHISVEAGERPSRTPWSEGGAALCTGSWNHAEDIVPHQGVTAKQPSRVRDSDIPQRDEPDASLTGTSGSVGAPGSNPWGDPAHRHRPHRHHVYRIRRAHLTGISYRMNPSRSPSLTPWHLAHFLVTAGTTVAA